jgi:hypothetical protein
MPRLRNEHQSVGWRHQAPEQAKHACQRGAYSHGHTDPIGVNDPRGRDRDDDIDDHEAHGQQTDAEVRDRIIRGGTAGDRGKGYP